MARPLVPLLLALAACTDSLRDGPLTAEPLPLDSLDRGDSAPSPSDSVDSRPRGETSETDPRETGEAPGPPLILMVLGDDIGESYLWSMPTVLDRLAPEAVRFTRAYTTVPLCCPVRASFLAGGAFPAETGVQSNNEPNGGVGQFLDTDTLATRLQAAGFRTALIGKYLNGYELAGQPYVPPGWDLFLVPMASGDSYDTQLLRGSSTPDAPGEGVLVGTSGEHLTGWLFGEALAFLDEHPDEPTFVFLTPQSPHVDGNPATEDVGTWAGFSPRPVAFAEEDVSDKPGWIQDQAPGEEEFAQWDADTQRMMENTQSLDRALGDLLDGLEARGLMDRAQILFAGDNGYLHGEHRLAGKGLPYEEAVGVPVLIRSPGVPAREDDRLIAMNLDLPATIADLAGVAPSGWGESLLPAVADSTTPDARDHVFLETY